MIRSFSIKGFKQFTDVSLTNLNPITLIGGKNNSGKTSILEALFLFYDRGNPEVTLRHLLWRGVGAIDFSPESLWSPIFYSYDMKNPIEIEVTTDKETRETLFIRHNREFKKSVFAMPKNRGIVPVIETSQHALSMESLDFTYYTDGNMTGASHITLEGPQLGMQIENLNKPSKSVIFIGSGAQRNHIEDSVRFGQLDIIGQTDIIIEVLNIIEPGLKSLTTISKGDQAFIYGDIGLSRKVPVSHMGAGTAKLLSIMLAIASNENGIVLIDEIENGWHYSLFPLILKAFHKIGQRYNCQIVATTHSYEIIDSLVKGLSGEDLSDVTYIRLDKEKEQIKPRIYESSILAAALEREWEVR